MPTCILWYTMNYAVVTTKVDPQTKKEAQKTASELGMPLSVVIKAFLKQFIKTRSVEFSARDEEPSEYFIRTIKQAEKDLKEGKASPVFDNAKDAVAWLHRGE
jgi:addiction module RelB/DinJ family antitoxin